MTDFTYRTPLTRNLTAAEADANIAGLAVEDINFFVSTAANQDYPIALKMRYGGSITETTAISRSGTCTATFKVNSTALGGSANSVTSTISSQTSVATNTFVAGDKIVMTVSANSSCLDLAVNLRVLRTMT